MDQQQSMVLKVREAVEKQLPVAIIGGNTKAFYGYPSEAKRLDTSGHRGVIEYDPGELVITCRAGSLLSDISDILAEEGQHLPFEPPAFGQQATIGGTIACGFSGPRRPWSGSLRDYLLGVKLINGAGEVVSYGGQVMKNVAGYDISRLIAGSMGTLGVLLEASFKVLPVPAHEITLGFDCDQAEAICKINSWSGQPLPISGAFWYKGRLQVRLSGAGSETSRAAKRLRADNINKSCVVWPELREHQLGFFANATRLWRLSLPPATGPVDLDDNCLVDWGGAQRWYDTQLPARDIRRLAAAAGGHATLFRGDSNEERFHPLAPAVAQMHMRIKQAFDPLALFNPGRVSRDW